MGGPRHIYSDDAIRKYQGRMVSVNGIRLPVAVRYVAWGLFLFVVFPLVLAADRVITGAVTFPPLIDLIAALVLTHVIANATTGETNLAHLAVHAGRIVRAAVNTRRRPGPATSRDRVRARRRRPSLHSHRETT